MVMIVSDIRKKRNKSSALNLHTNLHASGSVADQGRQLLLFLASTSATTTTAAAAADDDALLSSQIISILVVS